MDVSSTDTPTTFTSTSTPTITTKSTPTRCSPPFPTTKYHVGIICPLHTELAAARAILDEDHGPIATKEPADSNAYFAGRVHAHNVVIACLPAGVNGVAAAATVATDMLRTFPGVRFGLLVGIGGGVPDLDNDNGVDVRLGDVVVSQPTGTNGGVVQYDLGKSLDGGGFVRTGMLNSPPGVLLTAVNAARAESELREGHRVSGFLEEMVRRYPRMGEGRYRFPGRGEDRLYSDAGDGERREISRPDRGTTGPYIHYGVIASGNRVVKDAALRDRLRKDCGALCVEMEAAGLMNNFPCLVIRGISDYADAYKNDAWQGYAAATSAAYAKELLLYVSADEACLEQSMQRVLNSLPGPVRLKVERDASYNRLKISNDGSGTIQLPYLNQTSLSHRPIPQDNTPSDPTGNSCFELLHVLDLSPPAGTSNRVQFDTLPWNQLIFDDHSYYTRASFHGLVRLACDHISSTKQSDARQILRTTIGAFTFADSPLGPTATFSSRQRFPRTLTLKPGPYDLTTIANYAAGSFLRREGAYLDYIQLDDDDNNRNEDTNIPPTWERMSLRNAVLLYDLEPIDCPRFMTPAAIEELNFHMEFACEICHAVIPIMEACERESGLNPMLTTLVRLVERKLIRQVDEFVYVRGTVRALLSAVLLRGDGSSDRNREGVQTGQSEARVFAERAMDLYERLEVEMRAPSDRRAFREVFDRVVEEDVMLVVSLAMIATLAKANASFMHCRAVEASRWFLEMLTLSDFDVLVA